MADDSVKVLRRPRKPLSNQDPAQPRLMGATQCQTVLGIVLVGFLMLCVWALILRVDSQEEEIAGLKGVLLARKCEPTDCPICLSASLSDSIKR